MPYIIDTTTNRPTEFQTVRATRFLNCETELFTVRRTTFETGSEEVSSEEWYLIAAEGIEDALECAEAETDRRYAGDWTHEHDLD